MPLDRVATLRNAEKLLRQGKVEPAIAEYLRIVEDQPRDLNSTNTLGDLYVRAGQVDKAVEQYIRIASILHDDGFLPKAGALYKKILKLKPDHEQALVQAAEIAANQGLLADARMYFKTVADRRRARGDARGVAQVMIRLGTLDPADFQARMGAAAARVDIGELSEAAADLKTIAAELSEAGRQPEAIEALRQAALIRPDDDEIRERLLDVYIGAGRLRRARASARSPPRSSSRSLRRSRRTATPRTRWACCARRPASIPRTPSCASTSRRRSWRTGTWRPRAST